MFAGLARLGMFLSVLAIIAALIAQAWAVAAIAFVVGCICTAVATNLGSYP